MGENERYVNRQESSTHESFESACSYNHHVIFIYFQRKKNAGYLSLMTQVASDYLTSLSSRDWSTFPLLYHNL